MENAPKTIPREEVTQTLLANLLHDQEDFKAAAKILKHGQKDRLLNAMAVYPIQDIEFDESEPELRVAVAIWKRISDTLVAVGTEAAIEGILQGIVDEGKAAEKEQQVIEETKHVAELAQGENNE
jgi:hypothetical protein